MTQSRSSRDPSPIRLAMIGMQEGNGHPFSWSAIINGYDPAQATLCPPVILRYLAARPVEEVRIPSAHVTHIWTDDPRDAPKVAGFARIPHIVPNLEDVLGEVDAVIIATDDGTDHVRRARPFVEARLPVFVDKPLATTVQELRQFSAWHNAGSRIHSSSGMRYSPELSGLVGGTWEWISGVTCKGLDRYGIHILEPIFTVYGSGFDSVRCTSRRDQHIVQITHGSGRQATIGVLEKAIPCFGVMHAFGPEGHHSFQMRDTYSAFRSQLLAVIDWFRTGREPFPFAHTAEMMAVIIAALRSRDRDGAVIAVSDVLAEGFAGPPS